MAQTDPVPRSDELVRMITPYFMGENPNAVLATLVDLTARWVLAHVVADEEGTFQPRETEKTRQEALAMFVKGVAVLMQYGVAPPMQPPPRSQ